MKRTLLPFSVATLFVVSAVAQTLITQPAVTPMPADSAVTARGPHHREWSRVSWETNPQGQVVAVTNAAYTELATGLHFWDATTAQWMESEARFEVTPEGYAVGQRGQHRVILAPNIAATNAVDVQMPDGRRLKSRPWGLALHDTASGKNVLIAELKDCTGQWLSPNVVIYPDAFDGLKAALCYTYTREGFEQDVVLYENPGAVEAYSLDPATTQLEIWTEFFMPPTPRLTSVSRRDGIADQRIEFEAMALGEGQAYFLDLANRVEPSLPVRKTWQQIGGRTFLVEAVRHATAKPLLDRLVSVPESTVRLYAQRVVRSREALVTQFTQRPAAEPKLVASITPGRMSAQPGLVLDYTTINSSQTNYVFKGDSTYYISGTVNLNGTTVIEGGTVIKFTNTVSAKLAANGTVDCRTGLYRPAVFTAKDDNSVGESITGSTGNPTNYYGNGLVVNTTGNTLHDLRFAYTTSGTTLGFNSGQINLAHVQFVECQYPIDSSGEDENTIIVDNGLFYSSYYVVKGGEDLVVRGRHLTVYRCNRFGYSGFGCTTGDLYLTNCLVVAVTNGWGQFGGVAGSVTTNRTAYFTNDPGGIFQTVGAASHYLADNSPYRNAGTTNLSASLLTNLRQRTTYPPLVLNTTYTSDTTLTPQAQRDTDLPDLGYHYDPLDYFANPYLGVTNSTLTISGGTVFATVNSAGVWLQDSSAIVSAGTPLTPNWIVRYSSVQEQPLALGSSALSDAMSIDPATVAGGLPHGDFRFTQFACLAGGGYHIYNSLTQWSFTNLLLQDCAFWSGRSYLGGPPSVAGTGTYKDNLFNRSTIYAASSASGLSFSNNLFWGLSSVLLNGSVTNAWYVFNNAFDGCTSVTSGRNILTNGYNAYINGSPQLSGSVGGDVVLSSFVYTNGPLGDFYQASTNLINVGSLSDAALAGLYHYTTQTSQVKETNSVVDIGFHYVAVDPSNGLPCDTDGDGVPDYLEDPNGNGTVDSGETHWQSASDWGLKVRITRPKEGALWP